MQYTYDNAGNLLNDGDKTYSYDGFNRTEKVETNDGQIQINKYDAEGLRYEIEENNKLVQFIFNENKEVIVEKTDENLKRLIRSFDLWASECTKEKTWYHYASDEQGSTIFVTDENEIKNRYEYDAWGNAVVCEETVENRFKYTGQQYDSVTQQYYLRARYYNPVMYYDPSGYAKHLKDVNNSDRRAAAQKKLDDAAKGSKGNTNGEPDFIFADNVIVPRNSGYKTFDELKKNLPHIGKEIPSPAKGNYHHIIEQNKTNLSRYSPEFIHNKQNIAPLNSSKGAIHTKVTGYYNSGNRIGNGRVRDYVNQLPANKQFELGRKTINRMDTGQSMVWNPQKGYWEYK